MKENFCGVGSPEIPRVKWSAKKFLGIKKDGLRILQIRYSTHGINHKDYKSWTNKNKGCVHIVNFSTAARYIT